MRAPVPTNVQAPRLLAFIIAYQKANGGVSPSFPDMMAGVGITGKAGVHRVLGHLMDRGRIRTLPHRARAIEVIPQEVPADPQDIPAPPKPLLDTSEGYLFYKVVQEEGYDCWLVPMERKR